MNITKLITAILISCQPLHADTPPPGTVNAKTQSGSGTPITATGSSLNVNVTNTSGLSTVNQGTAGSSPWPVSVSNFPSTQAVTQSGPWTTGRTWTLLNTTDSVNVGNFPASFGRTWSLSSGSDSVASAQSGAWTTGRTWSLSAPGDSVNVGNFPSSFSVSNFPATQPVSGTVASTQSGTWTTGRTWALSSGSDSVAVTGMVTTSNASIGSNGSAIPTSSTLIGGRDPAGNLQAAQMDASKQILVNNSANTQPISGTVTANAGTGSRTVVQPSGANLHANIDNFPGSFGRTWTLSSGTDSVNVGNFPSVFGVTQSTSPWVISGSVTANAGTNLNTSLLAIESGGHLASIDTKTPALGQALAAGSSPVVLPAAQITALTPLSTVTSNQGTNPWVTSRTWSLLNTTDSVNVGNFPSTYAVTQSTSPWVVSGTVASTQSGAWTTGRTWSLLNSTDSVNAVQSGTWTVQQGSAPWSVAQSGAWNLTNITGTISLPTGASTSANQTNGSQKTQIVDGTGAVAGPEQIIGGVNYLPTIAPSSATVGSPVPTTSQSISGKDGSGNSRVVSVDSSGNVNTNIISGSVTASVTGTVTANNTPDSSPATQNITTQDSGSTTTAGANGQNFITGTPTAGSTASFNLSSVESVEVQVTGTWTGTLSSEISLDGGTTWYTRGVKQAGAAYVSSTFTAIFAGGLNVSGMTSYRVRATAAMTGTATAKVVASVNPGSIIVTNPQMLRDATIQSVTNTIKAASTSAGASDTSLVVAVSPNTTVKDGGIDNSGIQRTLNLDGNGRVKLSTDRSVFGSTIVVTTSTQVTARWDQTIANNQVTAAAAGGGSNSQASGILTIASSSATTASASVQTTATVKYYTGRELYALFTAGFSTPTSANSNQRAGLYDANNGFYIGYNGTSFGVTLRNGAADTFTSSASFTDPLNGSASSKFFRNGVAEAVNFANENVYRIRFGWLGSAPTSFEILDPDGDWVTFYTIKTPNTQTSPSIQTPNLPITMEVLKVSADATNVTVISSSWDAGTAGNTMSGEFNSTLPSLKDGQRFDMQMNQFAELAVVSRNKFLNVHGAATTTVKSGSGRLHTLCLNNLSSGGLITMWDNTSASGTLIASIVQAGGTSSSNSCMVFDIEFSTGLTITTTVASNDITVTYQ